MYAGNEDLQGCKSRRAEITLAVCGNSLAGLTVGGGTFDPEVSEGRNAIEDIS